MAHAKTTAVRMDRRELLRMTGTYGFLGMFVSPQRLLAEEKCEVELPQRGTTEKLEKQLYFWIDGVHLGSRSDLSSRSNITVYMDIEQRANSYVEAVILADEMDKVMGAFYFDASMRMRNGRPPYVSFENVELDPTKDYQCHYVVKEGANSKIYSAPISKPTRSRLDVTWLPTPIKNDFANFLVGGNNTTPGLITTPFQFYTRNGLAAHCARGRMTEIQSDGRFVCNIDFMHADSGPGHYMRYFIVLDPVGRLLGYIKRGSSGENGQTNGAMNVTEMTSEQLQALQAADPNFKAEYVADIRDCPYVQIYTEDSFDALARSVLRFR
jgi:hypothetical protein